ncbi:MAG: HAD family hydrolase [Treponema sp.]|jgi:phosphoglycolate phosphatase/putative hydrolase of the HAD superfamily|nr:HAD family hydrolase [Treponema sp.]
MKVFRLSEKNSALLFDMDSTLYTHREYARSQIDLPIKKLARLRGKTFGETRDAINRYRENWEAANQGKKISLGNIFGAFGVSIEESVRWREELYEPERYLGPDPKLRFSLDILARSFGLAVVTNNPVSVARRTLACLGVEEFFRVIVGLDTCGVSKPHEAPFRRAAELLGVSPAACVSVGDRYDIDIALPLELGMGGILVDGVEDLYRLPELFGTGGEG